MLAPYGRGEVPQAPNAASRAGFGGRPERLRAVGQERMPAGRGVAPLGIDAFGAWLWSPPPSSRGYLTLRSAAIASRLEL
jgi:hypothetical protein